MNKFVCLCVCILKGIENDRGWSVPRRIKIWIYALSMGGISIFSMSCEDLIELDLGSADPKIVIVADFDDVDPNTVQVTKTVDIDDPRPYEVVKDAVVVLYDLDSGVGYQFVYDPSDESYLPMRNRQVDLRQGVTYQLNVRVGDEMYTAEEVMQTYTEVDSIGTVVENVFNESYYYATFKFYDNELTQDYYKYDISVDRKSYVFSAVFNDKFDNGLRTVHQVGSPDNDIEPGSEVVVKRQKISKAVFQYWNEIQNTNPGLASPDNPTSNFSNGALGYFSVSSGKRYTFLFENLQEDLEQDID